MLGLSKSDSALQIMFRRVILSLQLDAARMAAYKASPMMEVVNMVGH